MLHVYEQAACGGAYSPLGRSFHLQFGVKDSVASVAMMSDQAHLRSSIPTTASSLLLSPFVHELPILASVKTAG